MSLTFGIDWDGTIVQDSYPPMFRPGALQALRALKAAGHHLVLHSSRCNQMDPGPTVDEEIANFYRTGQVSDRVEEQWARFIEMRSFAQGAGIWELFDEVHQAPGKPICDIYLDDKAETPDWAIIIRQFGQRSMAS